MQVWAVTFGKNAVTDLDGLYQQALSRLDPDARKDVVKYYNRIDSIRGLLGKLLIRLLLKERGVPLDLMAFAKTDEGKPYVPDNRGFR